MSEDNCGSQFSCREGPPNLTSHFTASMIAFLKKCGSGEIALAGELNCVPSTYAWWLTATCDAS